MYTINESIDKDTFFSIANDLIKATPTEQKVVAFEKKMCGYTTMNEYGDERTNFGIKFFTNFMS
jgi:hypothetical protein